MRIIRIFVLSVLIFACTAITAAASAEPMRGVWVSTVYNLDFPSRKSMRASELKAEIDNIVDDCASMGFNAVFFQVRPCADALYPSAIYPWSAVLSGTQGIAPNGGFDPLSYWIEKCHSMGIELHAWINPYRVTKGKDAEFAALSPQNPAVLHPEWVVKHSDGNYYLNPGIAEVRALVTNGVREIIDNYNVDGIHMDDYFYPDSEFEDADTFAVYGNGFTDIGDWRRNNVNLLVKSIFDTVHSSGKNIIFGISPAGIWNNKSTDPNGSDTRGNPSYSSHYADSVKWVKDGIIDYLAPQIYWEFGYSAADYGVLAKWWENVFDGSNVKLYIGLASYRGVGAAENSAWYSGTETGRQMSYNAASNVIDGEIHFRYKLIASDADVRNVITQRYRQISVFVNGAKVVFDTPPIIVNDRTMVPLRAVFEALGADVDWNDAEKRVDAVLGDDKVTLKIGEDFMSVNGEKIPLDSPPFIKDGRTLIPLRAVSEAFRYNVEWNGDTKTVTIRR